MPLGRIIHYVTHRESAAYIPGILPSSRPPRPPWTAGLIKPTQGPVLMRIIMTQQRL